MPISPKRSLPAVLSTLALAVVAAESPGAEAAPARAPQVAPAPGPTDASPPATAVATPSVAGGFGDSGSWVISPERLFGFTWRHQSSGLKDTTSFSLFAVPEGLGFAGYSWPRLALDYFVAQGISLGAAASFFRGSEGQASLTIFELAPRIGYSTRLGPWLYVWPRLGFTYFHATTQSFSAVTVEAPLVFTPWSKPVALTVGPSLDFGVAGSLGSATRKITDVSLMFGLAF
jgi:hypothetical protein